METTLSKKREEELYEAEKGRPPRRLPADHPDRWQWDYRGTKGERGELLDRLGVLDDADPAAPIEGQEELPL